MGLFRVLFRPFKVVLRPFAAKLRMLMSASVDSSRLNADVVRMRVDIDHLLAAMRDAHGALGRIEGQIDSVLASVGGGDASENIEQTSGLRTRIERVAQRADEVQRGIYDVSANVDRLIVAAGAAASRDGRVQLGVDALRRGQDSFAALVGAVHHDQQAMVDEAAMRSDAILVRTSELLALSGVLVSRADMLAERQTIPLGSEILMQMPEGLLLVPAEDSALVTAVWETRGRLEPGTVKVITALLREGDCVIDVGANIGLVTLPAARAVGPTGHVVAVEPSARIADLLQKTSYLNLGPNRVSLHRLAAGEEAGTAVLHIGATAGHSSLLPSTSSAGSETVGVARLDDLIEPGRSIRLVKIDAEGFELAVWRGMQRIVAENSELIVVVEFGPEHLQRAGTTVDAWLDAFQAPGFTIFEIDEMTGSLQPLRSREALHQVVSLNLVLFRRSASKYPMLDFA